MKIFDIFSPKGDINSMKRFIIAAMLCLECVACKVDFDFSGLDSEPILYLDMNLDYNPSRYEGGVIPKDEPLSLSGFVYAIPSAAGKRDFPEDLFCRIEIYRNSELECTRDDIMLHEFAGLIVLSDIYGLVPGDELKVVASAEGFPTATSTVIVPQTPPELNVSHTRIDTSRFRLSLTFEDDPDTEDCYAFTFTRGYLYEGSLHPSGVTFLEPSFGNTEDTSFLGFGPFDVIWEDGEKFYGLSDRSFNGKTKTIEFNVDYPLYGPSSGLKAPDRYAYYWVGFHRISPERLRYQTACSDKGSNILGFMGLAPATFSYTNVTGGTGCISCSSFIETDMIAVPPLQ